MADYITLTKLTWGKSGVWERFVLRVYERKNGVRNIEFVKFLEHFDIKLLYSSQVTNWIKWYFSCFVLNWINLKSFFLVFIEMQSTCITICIMSCAKYRDMYRLEKASPRPYELQHIFSLQQMRLYITVFLFCCQNFKINVSLCNTLASNIFFITFKY